ncbi:TPA: hypothetical protein ACTW28_005161 [Klebsiella quasipneumoniae subsp. similipneumoniae]
MEQVTESFAFLRYVPLCLAAFLWIYYFLTCSEHNKYSDMQRLKQWNDLPRHSATESKEETLKLIVKAQKRKVNMTFKVAIMFSVIGVFWLFYIK